MGGVLILLGLFSGILLWGDLSKYLYLVFTLYSIKLMVYLEHMMIIKRSNLKTHLVFRLNLNLFLKL